MASLNGFDANTVEPIKDFEPLPAGRFPAAIIESEMKPTKAKNGSYLQLTFEILEGSHKGRLLWTRLNLDNPTKAAVEIAQAELAAICRAVGVMKPEDSTELHNLPLVIKVICTKRKDTEEIVNEIKGYSRKESSPPSPAPAAVSSTAAPWKR